MIIDVFVMDHQEVIPVLSQNNKNLNNFPSSPLPLPKGMRPYKAMLDTGASSTCISSKVAQELNLQAIGLGEMISASERTAKKKYLFAIGVTTIHKVNPMGQSAEGSVHMFMPPIEGLEFHRDETTKFDVILGMDIIMRGSLKLDFDGHFSFCF